MHSVEMTCGMWRLYILSAGEGNNAKAEDHSALVERDTFFNHSPFLSNLLSPIHYIRLSPFQPNSASST
jgi:hypothetical protein